MKKKFDWNQPITWKGYAKFSGICLILGICATFIEILWIYMSGVIKSHKTIENDLDDFDEDEI